MSTTLGLDAIADFIQETGKKNHWEVYMGLYNELKPCLPRGGILTRNLMGIGRDQECRWIIRDSLVHIRVLDTDGLWWHVDEHIDLRDPDSLERIEQYLL